MSILCNDCLAKSKVKYHYMRGKCNKCGSYNTTRINDDLVKTNKKPTLKRKGKKKKRVIKRKSKKKFKSKILQNLNMESNFSNGSVNSLNSSNK